MSPSAIEQKFSAYIKAFNTHDTSYFGTFYAPDFQFHIAAFPPTNDRASTLALFDGGLAYFRETIHPTWLSFGERSVAMEAQMHSEAQVDMDFPFPFTGKMYKKGEKFLYPIM